MSDQSSWNDSHRRSSHLDRVHQGIRDAKARILFQEAFGNLLFERQSMLRQRFDLVEKLWRDDDNGMMSRWDGEGGVFELWGWCQACDDSRKERSSRSDLFVTFGQGALKTWVPGLPKNWRIINFLVALGENKTQGVGNDEQREARKNLGGLQPRSRRG